MRRFRRDRHEILLAARLIRSTLVDQHALFGRDDIASLQAVVVEEAFGRDKVRIFGDRLIELWMLPPLARDLFGSLPRVVDTLTPFVAADFWLARRKIVVERALRFGLSKTQARTGESKADCTGNGHDRSRQRPKPPCVSWRVVTSSGSHADDSKDRATRMTRAASSSSLLLQFIPLPIARSQFAGKLGALAREDFGPWSATLFAWFWQSGLGRIRRRQARSNIRKSSIPIRSR